MATEHKTKSGITGMSSSPIFWINGSFQNAGAVHISVSDRGFLLGDGIFDTMAVENGTPQSLDIHLERLRQNADVMGITLPYTAHELSYVYMDLISKNQGIGTHAAIRTTVTRGSGARGLAIPDPQHPVCLITIASYNPDAIATPAHLVIAKTVRRNDQSPLSRIKSLNYGDHILAKKEATERGADDAIFLNTKDRVCCTTNANIFVETHTGDILTPPLTDGVLAGTVRRKLLDAGHVKEQSLSADDLYTAKAVFLTNSLMQRRTVQRIDDTTFETA